MIDDLQHDPHDVPVPAAPPVRVPVPMTGAVPVHECGEALVALEPGDRVELLNLYHRRRWAGTSPTMYVRAGVAQRLRDAIDLLPDGFGVAVFDAWRSEVTVRALRAHFYPPGGDLDEGFLSDPDDPHVLAPHQCGAALDLTLTWQGRALALGTPFDAFTPDARLSAFEPDGPDPQRGLRRVLHDAVGRAGFVGLAQEWWHVSYGDQRWAAACGADAARYGHCEPG